LNDEQKQKAIKAYQKSGDAKHALRAAGIELDDGWVEQKRNSQGMVEILLSDINAPEEMEGLNVMEGIEAHARSEGLYDGLPQSLPEDVVDEAVALSDADRLLKLARDTIPQQHLAMFLAVEVDQQPLRAVAKEFNLSYRQVWQTVDSVRDSLRRIAEENENTA
jgi:DNA-directed RNA polymerase specialized sigma24 family protein